MGLTTAQAFGETRSLLGTIKQQNQQKRTRYLPCDKEALGQILRQVENLEDRQTLRRYMRDHLGVYFQYAGGRKERSEAMDALSLGNAVNLSRAHLNDFCQYADVVDWRSVYPSTSPSFFRTVKKMSLPLPRLKGLMLQNLSGNLFSKIPPCDILFLIYKPHFSPGSALIHKFAIPDWMKTDPPKLIVLQSEGHDFPWNPPPSLDCDMLKLRMPLPGYGPSRDNGAFMSFTSKGYAQFEGTWSFKFVGPYPDYERTKMGAPDPEDLDLREGNAETFSQMRERYFPFVYRNRKELSSVMTWRHALNLFA